MVTASMSDFDRSTETGYFEHPQEAVAADETTNPWEEESSKMRHFASYDAGEAGDILYGPFSSEQVDFATLEFVKKLIAPESIKATIGYEAAACLHGQDGKAMMEGPKDEFGYSPEVPDYETQVKNRMAKKVLLDEWMLTLTLNFDTYILPERRFPIKRLQEPATLFDCEDNQFSLADDWDCNSFVEDGAYIVDETKDGEPVIVSLNSKRPRLYSYPPSEYYNLGPYYGGLMHAIQQRFSHCVINYPNQFSIIGLHADKREQERGLALQNGASHKFNFSFDRLVIMNSASLLQNGVVIEPDVARVLDYELTTHLVVTEIEPHQQGNHLYSKARFVRAIGSYAESDDEWAHIRLTVNEKEAR